MWFKQSVTDTLTDGVARKTIKVQEEASDK